MTRSLFFVRYDAILTAIAGLIHMRHTVDKPYMNTEDAANWLVGNLPKLYSQSFPRGEVKKLKIWRVKVMLATASFLGGLEDYDIKCVRGRGLTVVKRPRLRRVA